MFCLVVLGFGQCAYFHLSLDTTVGCLVFDSIQGLSVTWPDGDVA